MEYIKEIVNEMINGTFSVFCGAGASCDATKQQWQDIFSDKTRAFYKTCSTDIYFLADLEKRYYNSEKFLTEICHNLSNVSNRESTHINNIINLNINQIWTTNFDSIIEKTITRKLGFIPTIIKESADLFTEDLQSRYIVYKLNGSIEKPNTMILTKSDYFTYLKKQRLFFELLKRQLVLDSFLFIGYSFADDLVLNALREIKEVFPNQGKTHYRFVVKNKQSTNKEFSDLESKYYFDEYNIRTIYVDNYSSIDNYLEKLYERFCNHNIFIAGSFRQLKSYKERVYIETLIGKLVEELINNNFNIISGNGRGLGEIVVAQINKHNGEKHFTNRPLIFTGDTLEQKEAKNHIILKDCDVMIIVSGQDDTLISSKNVINQFHTFINDNQKKYALVIPIPSTGYAAKQIYDSIEYKTSSFYLTNKRIIDQLSDTIDIDEIIIIVKNIIKSYKLENS